MGNDLTEKENKEEGLFQRGFRQGRGWLCWVSVALTVATVAVFWWFGQQASEIDHTHRAELLGLVVTGWEALAIVFTSLLTTVVLWLAFLLEPESFNTYYDYI